MPRSNITYTNHSLVINSTDIEDPFDSLQISDVECLDVIKSFIERRKNHEKNKPSEVSIPNGLEEGLILLKDKLQYLESVEEYELNIEEWEDVTEELDELFEKYYNVIGEGVKIQVRRQYYAELMRKYKIANPPTPPPKEFDYFQIRSNFENKTFSIAQID